MKPKIIELVLFLLFVFYSFGQAQVKISDNANTTIDPNSLLELESVNRGFLPPRVPIDSLTGESPLTAPVPAGMLVYSSSGSVPDGYYYWNGTVWKLLATELGGVNIAVKTSSTILTKDSTIIVASGNIVLTLPEVTSADNGLAIIVKNVGSYLHEVDVVGYDGVPIDNNDTVRLYRWKARTFIAYNGNWIRKEKDMSFENVYEVGASASWTTIPEILEFLAIHMSGPSTVTLDGGTYEISETQIVDLPHPLTIQGPSYGQAYISAANGLTGSPMFSCVSECSFKMLAFDATTLANYGDLPNEDAMQLVTDEQYHEIKDCTFDNFNIAIHCMTNVDIWLFESDISNCASGVEIAAGTLKYVSIFISESDFSYCDYGINMASGDSATVSVQNCTFSCDVGQIGLNYDPNFFINTVSLFFTNNAWDQVGSFINGFDFTDPTGRDANVDIINNTGIGDMNPKCQVSVIDNTNSTNTGNATTWYTPSWTVDDSYTINWAISGNSLTYLPAHPRDVFMIVSGNVVSNSATNITIAITKAPNTNYGATTIRIVNQQAGYPVAFSTVVYLQNVIEDDVFTLRFQSSTNATIQFQDVNIFANSQ